MKKTKTVAIIGHGYVGKAMYKFFKDHYNMVVYDPYSMEGLTEDGCIIEKANKNIVNDCDLAVVCVPTPQDEKTGECDLSHVHNTFEWLKTPLVIIKSTVEIGTTDKLKEKYPGLNIVFCPEFAGESIYWSEHKFHNSVVETPWFIFGGKKEDTTKVVDMYMKIGGPTKTYWQCEAKEAETAKYIENVFYATKVLFCYEMNELCQKLGVDYNTVRNVWLMDPRINPMHTSVFEENDKPFDGKCVLPDAEVELFDKRVKSIEDYYSIFEKIKNIPIKSADVNCEKIEYKEVTTVTKRTIDEEVIVFETEKGDFTCTKYHIMPVFRNGEKILVMAKDILESDNFFSI